MGNMDSPHILVYTDATALGGAEISLGHLVANVSKDFQITVGGVSPAIVNAIASRRPEAKKIILSDQKPLAFLTHLNTFFRLKPDVIHCNLCTPWACSTALRAALWLPNVRIVRVEQLPLRTTDAWTLWHTRLLALRVDAHVAVGKASARRMEDFYALGRDSVISIPNGVPDRPDLLQPPPARDGWLTVGSIGRLDAMKAHDVLIQAIAEVAGTEAVILGDGEQRGSLEQLAVDLGVGDRVQFLGWLNDPRAHLPNFDVVAMPSRSEGFPLAMVEAMLAERPVIATCVGSMPEAILNGETGILIEKNDVRGLAEALRQLRDDVALRLRLGKQARELAIAHFTAHQMTAQYQRLWQTLLQRSPVSRLIVPRPKD
jgi:glycosyltransferase involved in cell wall biosynthesis